MNINKKYNVEATISLLLLILFYSINEANVYYNKNSVYKSLKKHDFNYATLNCFVNSGNESFSNTSSGPVYINQLTKEKGNDYLEFKQGIPIKYRNDKTGNMEDLILADFYYPGAYKPFIGDCLKGILNDYILTTDEKKSLKYLLNKKSNFSFKEVVSDKTNYFLKIEEPNMIFPINIMIEIDQKNSDLITNIVSKRLRNSDTFLNGYWDSTIFFNSKIVFTEKFSQKKYIFKVLDGKLGNENFKTPWRIIINKPPKGYYKVNFYIETLSERFSNIKIKNLDFLIDNNFKIE